MLLKFRILLIVCILVYLGVILNLLRKKKLNLKFSLVWLLAGVAMLVACVFPAFVHLISRITGIVADVNTVFFLEGIFVLVILLSLTTIVSYLNERIRNLVQTIAILEKRVRELEKKEQQNGTK